MIGNSRYPIRRLILTGKDTSANIELLLGPNEKDSVKETHERTRIDVLLDPPRGSPNYCVSQDLDEHCSARNIRPPSPDELIMLQKIGDMQARIKAKMDSRGSKKVTNEDTKAILTSFGDRWVEMLPIYQHALNSMDQDAPAR